MHKGEGVYGFIFKILVLLCTLGCIAHTHKHALTLCSHRFGTAISKSSAASRSVHPFPAFSLCFRVLISKPQMRLLFTYIAATVFTKSAPNYHRQHHYHHHHQQPHRQFTQPLAPRGLLSPTKQRYHPQYRFHFHQRSCRHLQQQDHHLLQQHPLTPSTTHHSSLFPSSLSRPSPTHALPACLYPRPLACACAMQVWS